MILDQMIMERRNAILKCWPGFREHPPTVLIAEVIERSKTDMPDDFVPWAPGIVIPQRLPVTSGRSSSRIMPSRGLVPREA